MIVRRTADDPSPAVPSSGAEPVPASAGPSGPSPGSPLGPSSASTPAPPHRPPHGSNSGGRSALREGAVAIIAAVYRVIGPLHERFRRLRWAGRLHARVRRAGRRVYVYGPVYVLGTRDVSLGGAGNIYDNVLFETVGGGSIRIGDGFRINRGCVISSHARVTIGDGCLIGEYTSIRDHNHVFEDRERPIGDQGYRAEPVSIGDDVWLGRGVVVLSGVHIGRGAVIAANSVVTRNVPELEIWAGAPARFIRRRGPKDDSA